MRELVDISISPSQSLEYAKGLREHYHSIADSAVPEYSAKKQSNGAMPWDKASSLVLSAVKSKKRLERGV